MKKNKWIRYKGEWLLVVGAFSVSIQHEEGNYQCYVFKADDLDVHRGFPKLRDAKEYAENRIPEVTL